MEAKMGLVMIKTFSYVMSVALGLQMFKRVASLEVSKKHRIMI